MGLNHQPLFDFSNKQGTPVKVCSAALQILEKDGRYKEALFKWRNILSSGSREACSSDSHAMLVALFPDRVEVYLKDLGLEKDCCSKSFVRKATFINDAGGVTWALREPPGVLLAVLPVQGRSSCGEKSRKADIPEGFFGEIALLKR